MGVFLFLHPFGVQITFHRLRWSTLRFDHRLLSGSPSGCSTHAQSTFGCIVCHFVACSKAKATRSGEASSYKPPVNIIARGSMFVCGGLLRNPQGTQTAGCPVRFVMVRLALLGAGETNTSHCDMNLSISRINSTRARCARRYSTAGMKREVRNRWANHWALVRKVDSLVRRG